MAGLTSLPLPLTSDDLQRGRGSGRISSNLIAGSVILFIIIGLVLAAPLLTSFSPTALNPTQALLGPSLHHFLGTDELGRDQWTRLLYGGRVDLEIAFLAVLASFVLGTAIGCLAGYFGGWVDALVMRVVDVILAFPFFVLVIALVFILGPGTKSIYIAIIATDWVSYTWVIRREIVAMKKHEFVLAAAALGYKHTRIMLRHLIPNCITQAIVYSMSDVVFTILTIVTLGFLGLGVPPPTAEWGSMMSDGQQFITTHWELATFPGIIVVITGIGLSLFGDGIADLLRVE
ncbi:MAG TPA: ABC transporter permease [Acidimicrobiales bacterium]|jgi:peptide/nickel transport system permease protein|nr:ABC transporter permease [Acidimicrobiales bacterium]